MARDELHSGVQPRHVTSSAELNEPGFGSLRVTSEDTDGRKVCSRRENKGERRGVAAQRLCA